MEPFKFHSPTSIAIYAPPYSGKSTLTRKILEHGDELFTAPPSFTVYCYKEWLPMFDEMKHSVKGLDEVPGIQVQLVFLSDSEDSGIIILSSDEHDESEDNNDNVIIISSDEMEEGSGNNNEDDDLNDAILNSPSPPNPKRLRLF